jgi:hypothetical protein
MTEETLPGVDAPKKTRKARGIAYEPGIGTFVAHDVDVSGIVLSEECVCFTFVVAHGPKAGEGAKFDVAIVPGRWWWSKPTLRVNFSRGDA